MMTQPGAYVIPKLLHVYTSAKQMQNSFRSSFAKYSQIIFYQAKQITAS